MRKCSGILCNVLLGSSVFFRVCMHFFLPSTSSAASAENGVILLTFWMLFFSFTGPVILFSNDDSWFHRKRETQVVLAYLLILVTRLLSYRKPLPASH